MSTVTTRAVLAAILGVFSAGALAQSAGVVELRPGLLIDVGGSRLLTMTPDGGVHAVDVGSGDALWFSTACDRPLALRGDQLVCQRESAADEVLVVTTLSLADGALTLQQELPLPAGARALVDDGLGTSFQIAAANPADPGNVAWRFRRRVVQGMPGDEQPELVVETGALSVDPQAGRIVAGAAPAPEFWDRPAQVEQPAAAALQGRQAQGRQFQSASGNYLLLSVRDGEPGQWDRHRWTLYDRAGLELGSTRSFIAYAPFAVLGRTLLFVTPPNERMVENQLIGEPLLLRAVDLDTGQETWQRAIRDTNYYGPFPR